MYLHFLGWFMEINFFSFDTFFCGCFSVFCKFMLGSVHFKKQPPLPVFMDPLCIGIDLHQSAGFHILQASQTFSVDVFSLELCV